MPLIVELCPFLLFWPTLPLFVCFFILIYIILHSIPFRLSLSSIWLKPFLLSIKPHCDTSSPFNSSHTHLETLHNWPIAKTSGLFNNR